MKKVLLSALFFFVTAAPAYAAIDPDKFFAGMDIGTLGLGLNGGYKVNDMFKVRLNGNFFPNGGLFGVAGRMAADEISDDADADISAHQYSIGLLGDVHPFSGSFRVTGGIYYLRHDLSAKLTPKPDTTIDIGDMTYNADEIGYVDAEIKWNKIAPYLGVGWDTGGINQRGLSFSSSLGILYSKPTLDITAQPNPNLKDSYPGTPAQKEAAYAEFEAELQREIDKETSDVDDYLKWMRYYPVITVGLTYRF